MRVAVTGITGLLGKYLLEGASSEVEVHGLSRGGYPKALPRLCTMHVVNLEDLAETIHVLEAIRPDVIIHAAAEGRVDVVEGNADRYRPLMVDCSRAIAALCAERSIQFAYVSSNAVFGGSVTPYSDWSAATPVNDYGMLKAEAESAVAEAYPETLIIRPILMYGWPFPSSRLNPVVNWVRELRAGREVSVVDDVWTEPLAAWDCARAVWTGIDIGVAGPVNVSGGVPMSLHQLAIQVSSAFGLAPELIRSISTASLAGLAPRPFATSFDLVRLQTQIGLQPQTPVHGLGVLRDTEVDLAV